MLRSRRRHSRRALRRRHRPLDEFGDDRYGFWVNNTGVYLVSETWRLAKLVAFGPCVGFLRAFPTEVYTFSSIEPTHDPGCRTCRQDNTSIVLFEFLEVRERPCWMEWKLERRCLGPSRDGAMPEMACSLRGVSGRTCSPAAPAVDSAWRRVEMNLQLHCLIRERLLVPHTATANPHADRASMPTPQVIKFPNLYY
jgi:hypothetical protein